MNVSHRPTCALLRVRFMGSTRNKARHPPPAHFYSGKWPLFAPGLTKGRIEGAEGRIPLHPSRSLPNPCPTMALLHRNSSRLKSPFPRRSDDFHTHRHTKRREAVEAGHPDGSFGFLVWQGAGFEGCADQGFKAGHGGFRETSSVVCGLDLPGPGADLGDPLDDCAACRRRVFGSGRRNDRRPLARRDDRACALGKNSLVAAEAVVCVAIVARTNGASMATPPIPVPAALQPALTVRAGPGHHARCSGSACEPGSYRWPHPPPDAVCATGGVWTIHAGAPSIRLRRIP